MLGWLESIAGPNYAPAILWTLAALVFLVVILLIVKLIRSLTFGTYVAGGRNRKTRLAVTDATAVDSHRRLVLVRRDDIEHLILIGGPTDVVVERDIRMVPSRRPVLTGDGQPQAAAPAPARQQQRPAQPAPAPQPVRQEPPRQQANHVSHREPVAPAAAPRVQPQPAAQMSRGVSFSRALLIFVLDATVHLRPGACPSCRPLGTAGSAWSPRSPGRWSQCPAPPPTPPQRAGWTA